MKSNHDQIETTLLALAATVMGLALLTPSVIFFSARNTPEEYRNLRLGVRMKVMVVSGFVATLSLSAMRAFPSFFSTKVVGALRYEHLGLYLAAQATMLAAIFLTQPIWKWLLPKRYDLSKTLY